VVELKLHSELHVFVPTFLDEVPAYRHFINVKSVLVKIPVVGKIRRKENRQELIGIKMVVTFMQSC
jgi:hypothetical protein